jgi:mycothiol synthase
VSRIEVSRVNRGFVVRSHDHVSRDEFETALRHIARQGGGSLRWFVCEATELERALAAEHDLRHSAPLLHMRCALPLDARHRVPTGFTTRPFRPGVDDDEWLAVNARAFASHAEQGGWTREVLAARFGEPWFDTDGFLIHEIDGAMAGFCWTKMHDAHEPHEHPHDTPQHHDHAVHGTDAHGEIYVIGVDPAHHGQGLGRALTVAGFAHLASRGLRNGMLYVAGDNHAAISLYESLGMTVAHRDEVFVGTVAANSAR